METVLIAGGSGTIGTRLTEFLLQKGYQVIILSRKDSITAFPELHALQQTYKALKLAHWDTGRKVIAEEAVSAADYIINLAGTGIAEKRWTRKQKALIRKSRIDSCALIIQGLRQYNNKVKAVVSASAIGWYGPDKNSSYKTGAPGDAFTEEMPAAGDFLGNTCKAWETSIAPVGRLGKRLVILRTGIVLSKTAGAFTEFCRPLRFRIAAILGSGNQVVSWIHEDDLCNAYIHAFTNNSMNGVYNAVAPYPVTNKELVTMIARQKCHKWYIPFKVPSFILRITLGEMAQEVLKSTTVSSRKLAKTGFVFRYKQAKEAIAGLSDKL